MKGSGTSPPLRARCVSPCKTRTRESRSRCNTHAMWHEAPPPLPHSSPPTKGAADLTFERRHGPAMPSTLFSPHTPSPFCPRGAWRAPGQSAALGHAPRISPNITHPPVLCPLVPPRLFWASSASLGFNAGRCAQSRVVYGLALASISMALMPMSSVRRHAS